MLDILIKNAKLSDGTTKDIAVNNGKIVGIDYEIDVPATEVIQCSGGLVSPPFIDPHFHMDATLSYGIPEVNKSGTLLEGIELWGKLKPLLTYESVKQRALNYCDWAVSMGILAIRTHVDVCDDRLLAVDALNDVKEQVKPYMDIQLVAFPQDGLYRTPNSRKNLIRSLDRGIDVVGGIPHFERTMQQGSDSVYDLCEIASERGLPVDMHCDETDDPMSRHVEVLADATLRYGLQKRVTGSHLTSMHSMDNYYASKLLDLIAESQISVISNPLVNIIVQGQHDTYPKRRGMTRVNEMIDRGILVGWGQDCVLDPWYPLGGADMLDVAHMGLHLTQMTSQKDMHQCYEMITTENAKILELDSYGIKINNPANLVVLDASDQIEAIRLRSDKLFVISKGKIVSRKASSHASLSIKGRPNKVTRWRSCNIEDDCNSALDSAK